jgi:hypothetical protein
MTPRRARESFVRGDRVRCVFWRNRYFAGGCGEGEACGVGCCGGGCDPAGAGVGVEAVAACCGGCAAGLIQQA